MFFLNLLVKKIKKGDTVLSICGKDKNKRGKVIDVDRKKGRIVVENMGLSVKHEKPSGGKSGGKITFESSSDASNFKVVCMSCDKPTRVAYSKPEDGKKYRVCKHCGASLERKFVKV